MEYYLGGLTIGFGSREGRPGRPGFEHHFPGQISSVLKCYKNPSRGRGINAPGVTYDGIACVGGPLGVGDIPSDCAKIVMKELRTFCAFLEHKVVEQMHDEKSNHTYCKELNF